MSEDTTQEVVTAEEIIEDVIQDVNINGVPIKLRETSLKKGKQKGQFVYIPEVNLSDEDPFEAVKAIVGAENWNRELFKLIRQSGIDASHDARDPDSHTINLSTYGTKFIEQFTPGSRRAGSGIKQLREHQQELFNELSPFMVKVLGQEALTEQENNRYLQLLVEYSEVNEKIENASRTGKGKKKAAAAK